MRTLQELFSHSKVARGADLIPACDGVSDCYFCVAGEMARAAAEAGSNGDA